MPLFLKGTFIVSNEAHLDSSITKIVLPRTQGKI